jgi:ribosomal protein L7/L12
MSATLDSFALQHQLNRIEAKLDLLLQQAGLEPPVDPLTLEVKQLLRANQTIAAVKLVRQTTGMGLKAAKDWVGAIAAGTDMT